MRARYHGERKAMPSQGAKLTTCLSVFALVLAAEGTGCGARTGLPYPEPPVDAGLDAPVGCTPGMFALVKAQPALLFVLDRSGSMGTRFSGVSSRWQILTGSLQLAL